MPNDLQQARIEAALNGFYETEHKQAGVKWPFARTAGLENWSPQSIARMEAALAAADSIVTVGQIAEVIDRVDDSSWRNIFPEERDEIAREVRALFGEVAEDE